MLKYVKDLTSRRMEGILKSNKIEFKNLTQTRLNFARVRYKRGTTKFSIWILIQLLKRVRIIIHSNETLTKILFLHNFVETTREINLFVSLSSSK